MSKRALAVLLLIVVGLGLWSPVTVPAAGQVHAAFAPYQRLVMLRADPAQPAQLVYRDVSRYGALYSWAPGETALLRETHYGYNDAPILSPDGSKVVYLSLPLEFVQALQSGQDPTQGMGPEPTNIWLMDLTTAVNDPARFVRIADQVAGLPTDAEPGAFQRRSNPVWSPDSTRIAWLELDYVTTAFSGRIMVYDTRMGITQIAARGVSLGYADAGQWGVPNLVGWGRAIANASSDAGVYPNQPGGGFGINLTLVDPPTSSWTIPMGYFATMEDALDGLHWVTHRGAAWLALHYTQSGWIVLDPVQGTYERPANPPLIHAITGVGWSWPLVSPKALVANGGLGGEVVSGLPVTFTPAGNPVWIDATGQLAVLDQGSLQLLPLPIADSLRTLAAAWVPVEWMTDGAGTPTAPQVVP